jgi:hypothetical protein
MNGALVPQHLGALIIVTNYILLSALVDGCIVVAAGSITTTVLCSVDKLNGFYETEILATELS